MGFADDAVDYHLGKIAFSRDDYDTAESYYRAALEINETQAATHDALGVLYLTQERRVEAKKSFRRVLQLNEHWHQSRVSLARILADQNLHDMALEHLDKVLATTDNEFLDAVSAKADVLTQLERFEEAEEMQQRIFVIKEKFSMRVTAEDLANHGAALLRLKRRDDAIEKLERALRLKKRLVPALLNLGHAWYGKAEIIKARPYYVLAKEIDPDNQVAINMLSKTVHHGAVDGIGGGEVEDFKLPHEEL